MKILFGSISILLIAAAIFFFNQKNSSDNSEVEETIVDVLNSQEKNQDKTKRIEKQNQREEENQKTGEVQNNETNINSEDSEMPVISEEEESEQEIVSNEEEDDTPEYSEEVSSEDFKEFVGIALEELDSGDELAEAIITEMIKIAQAQPDHLEQVKNFYQACSQKSNISQENQQLCLKFLETINSEE